VRLAHLARAVPVRERRHVRPDGVPGPDHGPADHGTSSDRATHHRGTDDDDGSGADHHGDTNHDHDQHHRAGSEYSRH